MRKRRHLVFDLALQPQQLSARDQQTEVAAFAEEHGQVDRCIDHLLEVVEDEEQGTVADALGETAHGVERLSDRLDDEGRLAQIGKADPEDTVRVVANHVAGSLDRQPRLPGAAGAGQSGEPSAPVTEERGDLGELPSRGRRTTMPAPAGSCC